MLSAQTPEPVNIPQAVRYEKLTSILAEQFGLSIQCFPPTCIRMLLAKLPDEINGSDLQVVRRIVTACSIGETMFMRHPEQFAALAKLTPTLPSALLHEPIQAWSAGCATGEEAYSIAASLHENYANGAHVLGSDLNQGSVERAKMGRYTFWSMRGTDSGRLQSWLQTDAQGISVLNPVKRMAVFQVLNLMAGPYPRNMDLIFCRNVLLYFFAPAADQVLAMLAESLRPGGVLVLGYTDPIPSERIGLKAERIGNAVIYRRTTALPAQESAPPPKVQAEDTPTPEEQPRRVYEDSLSIAKGLAAQRAFDDALALLQDLVRKFPLESEPNVLGAMIAEEAGLDDMAIDFARRACFLNPHEPLNHYLLGVCFARLGERQLASDRLRLAAFSMRGITDTAAGITYGCGLTGNQLRRMIDACQRTLNEN